MAMKICKECGSEVSSQGRCPKCGKDQRNFFVKHKVLTFILCVIVLGTIISVSGGKNNNSITGNTLQASTNAKEEKFTLQDGHKGSTDKYGMSYNIEGSIKNNTSKVYTYVQVTFNLYDADGAQIGTAMSNINNLEAEGLWKFKAMGSLGNGKSVASYKLMEITGW